ncbi:hypothetical protein KSS87_004352 [Heliosperma pusillum]|nr:hypothetical protein KSS87_004352 [Heliosperma pusillum]
MVVVVEGEGGSGLFVVEEGEGRGGGGLGRWGHSGGWEVGGEEDGGGEGGGLTFVQPLMKTYDVRCGYLQSCWSSF